MNVVKSVYRLLSSRTIAVVLLLTLAAVALTGSLISQLSLAGVKWAVRGVSLHPMIERLSLDDLFRARWLAILVLALMLNLLLCSVNRLRPQFLKPGQIRGLLHFRQIATSIPIEESCLVIEDELRARGFRVRRRENVGSRFLSARRNGFSLFGSIIFHLSLAIAFLGFVIRSQKGLEGELVLFPDQSGAVRLAGGDTLQIQLADFGADYNLTPGGDGYQLRQRQSSLIIYRNNHFERADTLSINHPVWIHNLGLFQAEPAQLFVIRIAGDRGEGPGTRGETHPSPLTPHPSLVMDTMLRVRENEPFELGGSRFFAGLARLGTVYWKDSVFTRLPVHAPLFRLAPADSGRFREQLIDSLRAEEPIVIGDYRLNLLNVRQGAKIAYRYDPGLAWFYVAGALFLLGMLLRGFLPAHEFYATITEEEGETVIRLGGRALGVFTSLRPIVNRIVDRLA